MPMHTEEYFLILYCRGMRTILRKMGVGLEKYPKCAYVNLFHTCPKDPG